MLYQLIPLTNMVENKTKIILDDRWHGSYAEYCLDNPNGRKVWYCCPDEANEGEPRCDYLLYVASLKSVRFVELKGNDSNTRDYKCCNTTWAHGFHQLEATYDKYRSLLEQDDTPSFYLCTSLPSERRPSARYTKYPRYRSLYEKAHGRVSVLFSDESDMID